jgi:hypothetical protein
MTPCLVPRIPVLTAVSRGTCQAAVIESAFRRIVRKDDRAAGPLGWVAVPVDRLAVPKSRATCCRENLSDSSLAADFGREGTLSMGFPF